MLYALEKEYNIILKLFYYVKIDFQRKKTSNLSLFYIILLIFLNISVFILIDILYCFIIKINIQEVEPFHVTSIKNHKYSSR